MADLNRREFVTATAVAACACTIGASAALGQDTSPQPHGKKPPATQPGPTDVGPLTQFSADGIVDTYAWEKHFYLITTAGKLIAISSVCTHKGCMVKPKDPGFKCPCHGAEYALDGTIPNVTKTNVPLDRFALSVDDKGDVTVDTSKIIDSTKVDTDPAAFLKVPAK